MALVPALALVLACRTYTAPPAQSQEQPPQAPPTPPTPTATAASPHAPTLAIGTTQVEIDFQYTPPGLDARQLKTWAESRLVWLENYYGRFPVPKLQLIFVRGRGRGISFGQAFEGREIHLHLGPKSVPGDLDDDWVFVHEMLHLGFPFLDRRHRWMREGLSTYVEPLIRARQGNLPAEQLWAHFHDKMVRGQPEPDDRGLDRTHTWGNVYWGGALFWLALDVDIRRQSQGRHSVDDLLRALADAGMDARATYEIESIFPVARQALGSGIFEDSYKACAQSPLQVNLSQLWANLGVIVGDEGEVKFNDSAPLAALRQSMAQP